MEKRALKNSELVLSSDSKIYHLNLKPEDIGTLVFLVGDPGRVQLMSSLFDQVDVRVESREFVTHTGYFNKRRVSVVSTGIGPDNIDITVNELDALLNIDFTSRTIKEHKTPIRFIRIGTSGALQRNIEPGSVIVTKIAGGFDNLLYYYEGMEDICDLSLGADFYKHMQWDDENSHPYFIPASESLYKKIVDKRHFTGITIAAPGFYGPQGRTLRIPIKDKSYMEKISSYRYGQLKINNFEMESSALYGLSHLLGHEALCVCIALANRITGKFITDYKALMMRLLKEILIRMTND